jgi:crotonobetainyl-CoA:carnitine CoA-transferase CaiB-like acyl-CoA transferase
MLDPLEGIRVIDLSRVLAGPQCASLLGDLGADVIKVEAIGTGDETRSWAPSVDGVSTAYMSVNRNKRSITVDLATERGRQLVRQMILSADVLIENFRTGTMERWHLGYDDLRAEAPRLVYASISAFGRTGELAGRPGYEAVLQAFSGLMSITGEPDGLPVRAGTSLLDVGTGIVTAHAILAALLLRERTGLGQLVDTSLLATAVTFLGYHAQAYLSAGEVSGRHGSGHAAVVPYRVYPCAGDDAVFVAAANQRLFERLCAALELEHLLEDERFVDVPARRQHRQELDDLIATKLSRLARDEVLRRLEEVGVPATPVHTLDEVLEHPQVREVAAVRPIHHAGLGHDIDLVASPFRGSHMNTDIRSAPPRLGEHTEDVLSELGFGRAEIETLRRDGVVG